MKQSFKSLLSVLSAMLLVVSAYGQVTTSALNGQVADESGEPLAGAVITAENFLSATALTIASLSAPSSATT